MANATENLLEDELPKEEAAFFLRKFSPYLHLDAEERNFPASLNFFVEHSDLWLRPKRCVKPDTKPQEEEEADDEGDSETAQLDKLTIRVDGAAAEHVGVAGVEVGSSPAGGIAAAGIHGGERKADVCDVSTEVKKAAVPTVLPALRPPPPTSSLEPSSASPCQKPSAGYDSGGGGGSNANRAGAAAGSIGGGGAPEGWRLVPLEAGADHWTWDAVLARQDVARHDLKLRPHRDVWIGQRDSLITVPCYGWARFLDKNAFVAPFLRKRRRPGDAAAGGGSGGGTGGEGDGGRGGGSAHGRDGGGFRGGNAYSLGGADGVANSGGGGRGVHGGVHGSDGGDCRGFVGRVVELKYIFTYTYNGSTFAVAGTPIGVHEGDLEHVTVRVDYDTQSVLEVFFSAHSNAEGRWVPTEKFYSDALLADPETRLALRAPPALQTGLLGSAFAFCGFGRSSSVDVGGAGPLSPGGYKTAAGSSGGCGPLSPGGRRDDGGGNGAFGGGSGGGNGSDGRPTDAAPSPTHHHPPPHLHYSLGVDPCARRRLRVVLEDGTHPAVYTARCGHASYPRPQRWSRFGGLGDDLAMGDGAVWRPPVVPLPHPARVALLAAAAAATAATGAGSSGSGSAAAAFATAVATAAGPALVPGGPDGIAATTDLELPPVVLYRGHFGGVSCLAAKEFWHAPGEQLRKVNPDPCFRSILEEGLQPDRVLRLSGGIRDDDGGGGNGNGSGGNGGGCGASGGGGNCGAGDRIGGKVRGLWHGRRLTHQRPQPPPRLRLLGDGVSAAVVTAVQTQHRAPVGGWVTVPGMDTDRPGGQRGPGPVKPPPGLSFATPWRAVKSGEDTDGHGWMYSSTALQTCAGHDRRPRGGIARASRARRRVWCRVALSPAAARAARAAAEVAGVPLDAAAVAAVALSDAGDEITAAALLACLGHRPSPGGGGSGGGGGGGGERGSSGGSGGGGGGDGGNEGGRALRDAVSGVSPGIGLLRSVIGSGGSTGGDDGGDCEGSLELTAPGALLDLMTECLGIPLDLHGGGGGGAADETPPSFAAEVVQMPLPSALPSTTLPRNAVKI